MAQVTLETRTYSDVTSLYLVIGENAYRVGPNFPEGTGDDDAVQKVAQHIFDSFQSPIELPPGPPDE